MLKEKLEAEIEDAKDKAIESLAKYKFAMFGYWAGIWVHLNRMEGNRRPSPFRAFVHLARELQVQDEKWKKVDERRTAQQCTECNSLEIRFAATAAWSVEKQAFVLKDVYEDEEAVCDRCGSFSYETIELDTDGNPLRGRSAA